LTGEVEQARPADPPVRDLDLIDVLPLGIRRERVQEHDGLAGVDAEREVRGAVRDRVADLRGHGEEGAPTIGAAATTNVEARREAVRRAGTGRCAMVFSSCSVFREHEVPRPQSEGTKRWHARKALRDET
jgi:hypothetical protein